LSDVVSSFILFADKLSAVAILALKKIQWYVKLYKNGERHSFY